MQADIYLYNWSHNVRLVEVERMVREYAKRHGKTMLVIAGASRQKNVDRVYNEIMHAKQVFMWGGHLPGQDLVKHMAEKGGAKVYIFENGWFPQAGNLHIDLNGICGSSSLNRSLDWVTNEMIDRMEVFRRAFRRKWGSWNPSIANFIVAPLQLVADAATALHSPFMSMQHFINDTEERYHDREIKFKTHPKHADIAVTCRPGNSIIRGGDMKMHTTRCSLVHGINSTSLYEAAMMGIPVTVMGYCPLRTHADDLDRLLAAMVACQIPKGTKDITKWVELQDSRRVS